MITREAASMLNLQSCNRLYYVTWPMMLEMHNTPLHHSSNFAISKIFSWVSTMNQKACWSTLTCVHIRLPFNTCARWRTCTHNTWPLPLMGLVWLRRCTGVFTPRHSFSLLCYSLQRSSYHHKTWKVLNFCEGIHRWCRRWRCLSLPVCCGQRMRRCVVVACWHDEWTACLICNLHPICQSMPWWHSSTPWTGPLNCPIYSVCVRCVSVWPNWKLPQTHYHHANCFTRVRVKYLTHNTQCMNN